MHGEKRSSSGRDAVDGARVAGERSGSDRRCGACDVQTDVLIFRVHIDRISSADHQSLIKCRVIGKSYARFEVFVVVGDGRNRGL